MTSHSIPAPLFPLKQYQIAYIACTNAVAERKEQNKIYSALSHLEGGLTCVHPLAQTQSLWLTLT